MRAFPITEWRSFLFVVVDTDEGVSGIGEAGITGRELAVAGMVEHLQSSLEGQDPFRIEHLWQVMFRSGFYPAGEILTAAIAAIDVALWDIKGKALGVPLYELLGGLVRDRVASYTHIHGRDTRELVARCRDAVDEGWRHLRWEIHYDEDGTLSPRRAVRDALKQWEAVRAAVGDDIELLYRRAHAIAAARRCAAVSRTGAAAPVLHRGPRALRERRRLRAPASPDVRCPWRPVSSTARSGISADSSRASSSTMRGWTWLSREA